MPVTARLLATIPPPPGSQLTIGPLHLRAYGLLIALGVFAAVWLADRRWQAQGGEAGVLSSIALWAVPAGLVGARLYHVVTDYELYDGSPGHSPLNVVKIWNGGLGIWGGIAGGVLAGWIVVRRRHLDMRAMLDAAAPALALAQAIGRWGNYFNQELYGRRTSLPWGLRVTGLPGAYHPTFLYESLWDLVTVALLLWVVPRLRLRKGYLFAAYVALYTFGRFWTEYLRIDYAHKFLGLRLNDWVSVVVFCTAVGVLLVKGRARPEDVAPGEGAAGESHESAGNAAPGPAEAGGQPSALVGQSAAVLADGREEIGPGPGQA